MNAQAADTAVLVSAIITLVAIASKLITANLIERSKRSYTKLDARRREVIGRLKEVQLKRTSARGTLEFWERRRTETAQRVYDAQRDLEAYEQQHGPLPSISEGGEETPDTSAEVGVDPASDLLKDPAAPGEGDAALEGDASGKSAESGSSVQAGHGAEPVVGEGPAEGSAEGGQQPEAGEGDQGEGEDLASGEVST